MIFRDSLSRKSVVTNFTFEWLISSMNCWKMIFHGSLSRTSVVTNFTLEWLFAFMNWWNMPVQATLFRTSVATNVTSEWLFYLMHWWNVPFFFDLKWESQISHLNDFFNGFSISNIFIFVMDCLQWSQGSNWTNWTSMAAILWFDIHATNNLFDLSNQNKF